jgi:hypothetical protein
LALIQTEAIPLGDWQVAETTPIIIFLMQVAETSEIHGRNV